MAVCRRVRWEEKGLDRPATERGNSSEAEPPERSGGTAVLGGGCRCRTVGMMSKGWSPLGFAEGCRPRDAKRYSSAAGTGAAERKGRRQVWNAERLAGA